MDDIRQTDAVVDWLDAARLDAARLDAERAAADERRRRAVAHARAVAAQEMAEEMSRWEALARR